ncbi:MAG TPA: sulfatase-like hydrolase/transferase, partial [Burkholderiales bacterium]|nr:sulfatase-like hydrolase/transferase [Burkholderiales bacterium]
RRGQAHSEWFPAAHRELAGRYLPLLALAGAFLVISTLTRLALFFHAGRQIEHPAREILAVLPIGLGYDLVTALYLFAPFAVYLWLVPERFYRSRWHRAVIHLASFATLFGLLYLGAVEYFFFEEFDARFNFVAVEYLIYPHEVFVNIWNSYPVGRVLVAVAACAAVGAWLLRPAVARSAGTPSTWRGRALPFALFAALLAIGHTAVNADTGRYSQNRVANELAQNGIYSFFHAALNHDLDYNHFYLTLDENEAAERLRGLVAQPNASFLPGPNPLARRVTYPGTPRLLNVVVFIEESLGAEFVGAYGDTRGLTPTLDRLAGESVMFGDVYATGTRTVRGLEAISASFPPLPGDSIVKRSHNEGLFNWSTVMRANGYGPTFIYGGFGTFDNMNYFFGNNGYRVVDRTDMDQPKFSNIWGVSDEDLFRNAIRIYDAQHAAGERIFSLVMTTSNHKPFTFPAGVPGVPEKDGGRLAGVRYADYALGRFFEEAKSRPWFGDTVFVVVGDHGARVYGKEDFPLRTYELPLLVYSPRHLPARRVDGLMSQIDIAPTVLGMLGISYEGSFFGRDVLGGGAPRHFAPLNHNRDIAILEDGRLTELNLRQTGGTYSYDKAGDRQARIGLDQDELKDAISVFQTAYNLYLRGQYRLN